MISRQIRLEKIEKALWVVELNQNCTSLPVKMTRCGKCQGVSRRRKAITWLRPFCGLEGARTTASELWLVVRRQLWVKEEEVDSMVVVDEIHKDIVEMILSSVWVVKDEWLEGRVDSEIFMKFVTSENAVGGFLQARTLFLREICHSKRCKRPQNTSIHLWYHFGFLQKSFQNHHCCKFWR